MSDWIDFDRWHQCMRMERPGIVFEVVNAERQRLLTNCTIPLQLPFDWTSHPVKFRVVEEPEPRHSEPLPKPAQPE